MLQFKTIIATSIAKEVDLKPEEIQEYIEIPKDSKLGDYAFPCFRLAKTLKKAPQVIASELKEKLTLEEEVIEKVEIVGGYLNFYINKETLAKEVLQEASSKKEDYGKLSIGEGKNIVIDYSAPNIAKPFHIGHLRSTVIGGALYNIYNFLGYHSVGINHLGDWGTQFGKLIEGYKRWGTEYDIEQNPIDALTKIYIRINEACKEDESILEDCRNNFKKLEDGDSYCVELWKKFRELSLKEFEKVYQLLGSHFDSWNGEAFYSDKMPEVVELLEKSGKLVESQGARIIELENTEAPCLIEKSNGSTTYATRDLAAILYRARTYDFAKALYVTSYEQNLHFKQVFEVAKLLGLDPKYTDNLIHVPFGMVFLKTGKMSTREGNIVKLEELLSESITRAKAIIEEKNPNLENKEEVARKVGIGAVIFNDLANSRIKDEIFDWDIILNFNGETGPYIQYIYVRTKSVQEKAGYLPEIDNIHFDVLTDEASTKVLKLLYSFSETVMQAAEKNEPSIVSHFLIELAKAYSIFYSENRIMGEEKEKQDARLYLTYVTGMVLKQGAKLLGMEMPEKM